MKTETLEAELKRLIGEYATLLNHTSYHPDSISRTKDMRIRIDTICGTLITREKERKVTLNDQ
jgi:hypothetical protein